MEKEEFLKKAKEAGFTEEEISEAIKTREDAQKDGLSIPYEMLLANHEDALNYLA